MYNAKERLEAELGMDEKRTQALHQHLLTIKQTLVSSLSTVPLPGQQSGVAVKEKCERKMKAKHVLKCSNFVCFYPHTTNAPVILLLVKKISQITPEYVTFDTRVSFHTDFQRTGGMRVLKLFGLSYFVFLNRYG